MHRSSYVCAASGFLYSTLSDMAATLFQRHPFATRACPFWCFFGTGIASKFERVLWRVSGAYGETGYSKHAASDADIERITVA